MSTSPSPSPLPAGCNPSCPACAHRSMRLEESLKQKEDWLRKKLSAWLDAFKPVQSVDPESRLGYRDKVTLSVRQEMGAWKAGMIVRDELISIPDCPVHKSNVNQILRFLFARIPSQEEFPLAYYVQAGKQLTLIVKTKQEAPLSWMDKETQDFFSSQGLDGVWIHYNPSAGRRLFEKTARRLIWGKAWSVDAWGMQYGPMSFQQLLPWLYHQSLQQACQWLEPNADSLVVDLYSGTGNSLVYWNNSGAKTIGVELGKEAVECAMVNAPHSIILRGKTEERIPQIHSWLAENANKKILLYANPPRTGIDEKTLNWIMEFLLPERICYLSCSAGTLSKNLKELSQKYEVAEIYPYDFFPLTSHVECLVSLTRKTG